VSVLPWLHNWRRHLVRSQRHFVRFSLRIGRTDRRVVAMSVCRTRWNRSEESNRSCCTSKTDPASVLRWTPALRFRPPCWRIRLHSHTYTTNSGDRSVFYRASRAACACSISKTPMRTAAQSLHLDYIASAQSASAITMTGRSCCRPMTIQYRPDLRKEIQSTVIAHYR